MARISGVEIPAQKKIKAALTYIYGLGQSKALEVLDQASIDYEKRTQDLTDEELARLQKVVANLPIEGGLRQIVKNNIKRLQQIGIYRGMRHSAGLPSRGQRTRHNARTLRGKRKTVGALKKEEAAKVEASKKEKETKK